MRRRPRTPPAGPIVPNQPMDPLWLVSFPIYFLFTLGYGLYATARPILALQGGPHDATGAQIFGILVTVASLAGMAGSLRTIFTRHDGLELFGTGFFVIMMAVYFGALTVLIAMHDPNTRPGSSFVPLCMSVFAAIRCWVIVRDRRRRRARLVAEVAH